MQDGEPRNDGPVAVGAMPEAQPEVASPAASTAAAPRPAGLPKVQAYDLPLQDLTQLAQSSGLEWVNSDAEKIRVAQEAIAAQPKPVHVPRERPAPVVLDEGPLVLVETRRDLRTMTLPFEQAAS
jgi:ribonuclease E